MAMKANPKSRRRAANVAGSIISHSKSELSADLADWADFRTRSSRKGAKGPRRKEEQLIFLVCLCALASSRLGVSL
jgi:hypothetical protein